MHIVKPLRAEEFSAAVADRRHECATLGTNRLPRAPVRTGTVGRLRAGEIRVDTFKRLTRRPPLAICLVCICILKKTANLVRSRRPLATFRDGATKGDAFLATICRRGRPSSPARSSSHR